MISIQFLFILCTVWTRSRASRMREYTPLAETKAARANMPFRHRTYQEKAQLFRSSFHYTISLLRGCIGQTFRLCYCFYTGTANASNGRSYKHPANTEISFGFRLFHFVHRA